MMKLLTRRLLLILSPLFLCSPVFADADFRDDIALEPYAGVGYLFQRMEGKKGWDPLMPTKSYHSGRLILGAKLHPMIGLEFGYSTTWTRKHEKVFGVGERLFDNTLANAATVRVRTKLTSFDFDLNGYYPLLENIEAVGTIGVAVKNVIKRSEIIAPQHLNDSTTYSPVLRLGLGAQYLIDNLGFRGRILFENTANLKQRRRALPAYNAGENPFKNNWGLGLCAFYRFI